MRVAVGTIPYIHTKFIWVGADPYMMTFDINKLYRWSIVDLWAGDISRDLLRFGFLICMVIGGQGFQILVKLCWLRGRVLSSDLVIFVLVGGAGFALGISEFDKVTIT
jgi:hypothetical protein